MTFNPVHANDILVWEPGPIEWIWMNFIPRGSLILFSGFMKTGKSTFIYPLAISVAQGRPFLGYDTIKGGVLILCLEEQWPFIHGRLRRFGLQLGDHLFVHCGSLSNNNQTLTELRNFILQNGVSFMVVDTLSMLWTINDENDNAAVVRQIKPLLDLARITQCAICLVHHSNKGGGEHGRGIRGASSLLGIVDQAIMLERRVGGNQNQRVLKTLGRYSESPSELILELQGDDWVNLGSGSDAWKMEQTARVLEALSHEPQTVESLVSRTDLSDKQVRKCLNALLPQGQVARNGKGTKGDPHVYSLA